MSEPTIHPRPQLRREEWQDLCGTWRFAFDDEDRGADERWFETGNLDGEIQVPYPPESSLSGVGDTSYHPVAWYAREVSLPEGEGRVLLHFGAVDYRADVWVNGQHVGGHDGGHTPFSLDVTSAVAKDRVEQTIVVRAEDQPTDQHQPRGKQVTAEGPRGIFYDRTTGIWQPVWLERVAATHVRELRWTTDVDAGLVHLDLTLSRPVTTALTVHARLSLEGVLLTEHNVRASEHTVRLTISLDELRTGQPILWSPETPTLIDAEIVLAAPAGELDRVQSYLGVRSVGWRDGLFLLNGKPYYLRMVLEQGYWPTSHLAAPGPDALRREVELIKELGFNGARVHQKIEDPRFLYWCDRLGLLTWGEFPAAFAYSPTAVTRTATEWSEAVLRDSSHPCVVAWVPLNESWGVPNIATSTQQQSFATAMYHLTKALDPTRPVISNDGWEHTVSDIWAIHDYTPSGESIRRRYHTDEDLDRTLHGPGPGRRKVMLQREERAGRPVMVTEFGGLAYVHELDGSWAGYSTVGGAAELRDRFEELVTALLDSPWLGGFCYTQLTDTQQERNGLLTAEREPKLPVEEIRRIVTRAARAIPAEEVDAYRRATKETMKEARP
ncbi:glycoside hydrolase family 2 protein [Pseudactinotalea terrae]|uniref:glycoside hydrolase family 2 protein n=1 Tax=Pseudactinotalea terrae TaxID=1743262 RepID=UPI0014780CB6|nr:sugar-binding domain-containing protein [Pseudactinotalea terrae]